MANDTCGGGRLAPLFPEPFAGTPYAALDTPGALAVQAAPTLALLCVWTVLEAARYRKAVPGTTRTAGTVLGLLGAGAFGVLAWRVFDVLACDDLVEWRLVAVVGSAAYNVVLLLALAPRLPRISTAVTAALAAATVVADWALRREGEATAAVPLVSLQQLWCLLGVVALSHLPGRRTLAARGKAVAPAAVDALARRKEPEPTPAPFLSWFA